MSVLNSSEEVCVVRWMPSETPSCGLDFTALGRSIIADRDPSGGSDEEPEKQGLVHGGSIL